MAVLALAGAGAYGVMQFMSSGDSAATAVPDHALGYEYLPEEEVPMGRFAEPEEIANAVLWLASDESSFVTASTFLVDGGISGAYVTPV